MQHVCCADQTVMQEPSCALRLCCRGAELTERSGDTTVDRGTAEPLFGKQLSCSKNSNVYLPIDVLKL